ncbi:MAG: substrate-binding domain-containing protein [Akkermansiaceae bacterium]|jgi:DNA-binding LacI/PurR family transcriptional regulator/predicted transcriptional regulator|nr:substrate-binding domain-containing protein [Akkermansiaceae bacterium]
MQSIRILSAAEQVARHLEQEILNGSLDGALPGVHRLAQDLGVNHKTVEAALLILETEGLLIPRGAGRRRQIVRQVVNEKVRPLRVAILLFSKEDRNEGYMVDLRHTLREGGHLAFHPSNSLMEMGMKPERVARLVGRTPADAWVVQTGSREILEWFSGQNIPVMALFGGGRDLPIASVIPDKVPAIRELTKALVAHGHRRIVFLAWKGIRVRRPSPAAQAFLDELSAGGISPGPYHMPDWKETVEGFHDCLESLFRLTPPTALIVDGVSGLLATQQFLAARRLRSPEDISIACLDWMPDLAWCRPEITHIRWDARPVVKRVVQWANHLAKGTPDFRRMLTRAEFVRGATIGPVNEP